MHQLSSTLKGLIESLLPNQPDTLRPTRTSYLERRASALDGRELPHRVGSGCSVDQEAAVQRHQKLKGGLPSRCRPTPGKRPTAAKAEEHSAELSSVRLLRSRLEPADLP